MRRQDELLTSRARVSPRYALLPLEGIPFSRLPHWPTARIQVLASGALGAGFTQYRMELDAGGSGTQTADGTTESFLYLLSGSAKLAIGDDERGLTSGGYALVPPDRTYSLSAGSDSVVLIVRKRYEPAVGIGVYDPFVSNEADVHGEIYLGDEGALLQTLIPDDFAYDMAMNIFTFETGHGLPVTETHVMEHGLVVLQGKGVYFLDAGWMEVEESDFIWMGPYCPQSYYATGPVATRYLYYKNVNREIAVP